VAVKLIKGGAVDYLLKPVDQGELLTVVDQAIARCAADDKTRSEISAIRARMETLTPREQQVMLLVVEGLPNKMIADKLGTAEKTVKVHRGRVMKKMEVHSIAQLVHDVEHALAL
jgi:FixJ family two-component response regulator